MNRQQGSRLLIALLVAAALGLGPAAPAGADDVGSQLGQGWIWD